VQYPTCAFCGGIRAGYNSENLIGRSEKNNTLIKIIFLLAVFQFPDILKRKIADILAKEEWNHADREWLCAYLGSGSSEELRIIMENEFHSLAADTAFKKTGLSELLLDTIHQKIIVEKPKSIRRIPIRWMIAASAAAVICFLITGQFWLQRTADSKLVITAHDSNEPELILAT